MAVTQVDWKWQWQLYVDKAMHDIDNNAGGLVTYDSDSCIGYIVYVGNATHENNNNTGGLEMTVTAVCW